MACQRYHCIHFVQDGGACEIMAILKQMQHFNMLKPSLVYIPRNMIWAFCWQVDNLIFCQSAPWEWVLGGNKRKQFQDSPFENALYLWFKWRRWSIWPFVANLFEEVEANGVKSVLNIPVVVDTAPQVAVIGAKEKQLWRARFADQQLNMETNGGGMQSGHAL